MKRKKIYNVFFCLIFITFIVTAVSMSKYQSTLTSTTVGTIAKWDLKVNDEDVNNTSKLSNIITLVPDSNANVAEGKMAPGYGGYFDIEIDPGDTEVSFSYEIEIETETLPTDLEIIGYKIDSTDTQSTGATSLVNNSISGVKTFPTGGYTTSDIVKYRFYWMWNDVRDNDSIHTSEATDNTSYELEVSVTLTQII